MTLLTSWEGRPVAAWQELWQLPALEIHDALPSTNDRAGELATQGSGPFTTVLAEEQTSGRGRHGRRWHSPRGSGLFLSTVLGQDGPVPLALPLLVGLAAARAVEDVAAGITVGLKWPNDLLVEGRKVGGILCESKVGSGPPAVVVGIGLNVHRASTAMPAEVAAEAACLEELAQGPVSRGPLATRLLGELQESLARERSGLSPSQREEIRHRDVLAGRRVVTARGEGTALGVDEEGGLLLRLGDGSETRVVAGSVRASHEEETEP